MTGAYHGKIFFYKHENYQVVCYNMFMVDFSTVAVIIMPAMIHATLQLGIGTMLLLYHASMGKHIKKRTKQLASNYILGSFTFTILMLASFCFAIMNIYGQSLDLLCMFILIGILLALAISVWFFYYRSGRSTELWLPKTIARYISKRAKVTDSNVESFSLGLLTSFIELPFSLALFAVTANSILELPSFYRVLAVISYGLIAGAPQIFLKIFIKRGKTVADIQKWRSKNKNFFRIVSGVGFLSLAVFLLAFKVFVEK